MRRNEEGFSLVEVLIAILVFAIGFLAMAKMQMTALHGDMSARGTTEASTLLQSKVNEIRMLPYGAAALADWNGVLADNELGDPGVLSLQTVPPADAGNADPATSFYGNTYRVFWTVAEDFPRDNLKTVRVTVVWNDRAITRRISNDFVRGTQY